MLPADPIILLSYVNTKLRDRDGGLDEFWLVEGADKAGLCAKLAEAGSPQSVCLTGF